MAADLNDLEAARLSAETNLDRTRDELRHLFETPADTLRSKSHFPRSKTMRFLTGGGSTALLALGAGGFLMMRPKLLKTVLSVVPINALIRMAVIRFMTRGK